MRREQLSTAAVLMLSSLAEGPRHGYAIRKDVARRTDDDVRLGITTLYRLLKGLLDGGLVEEASQRPAPELDDERRRYFRITPAGRRALTAEIRRLERVLAAAQGRTAGVQGRRS
jgi:DNA-binding PadR family transcriptional regulator